ncbi:MAG: ABC transporter permease [Acidobacteriia bacterium]|nr:ABC transporter permease [Terriglobia bacterium]
MLRRSPALTATIVLTLALGIGANTAIFTVVNSVLLRPLPFRDPARLVAIWDRYEGLEKIGVSPAEYDEWCRQTDLFEDVARYRYVGIGRDMNLTGGSEPERVRTTWASAGLFSMLGVRPAAGRFFATADDRRGGPPVALLSYRLWRDHFNGDPNIVGSPIQLTSMIGAGAPVNGQAFAVLGVLPSNFPLATWADVWLPESQAADETTNPVRHAFGVIARLKPNVRIRQAAARLDSIRERLEREHPATSKGFSFTIGGLQQDLAGNLRPALLVLLGAVTLVLLIACVNVANLLLARATARRHEMAVRIALGASRWRIVRESLAESLQLSMAGGAAGLLLAFAGLNSLLRLLPADLLDPASVHVDLTALGFLFAVSLATGLVFGIAPALQAAQQDPVDGLRETGRSVTRGAGAGRNALVVAEFSLALLLLMGAGLFIRSFARLLNVDPGFRAQNVLTLRLTLSPQSYPDDQKLHAFFDRLEARLATLPGVTSVAAANALPLASTRGNAIRFAIPGSPLIRRDLLPAAQNGLVTPGYFRTLGIPLLAGRTYTADDLGKPYIIVNQTMARTFWPGANPVGQRFISGPWGANPTWSTVIGVVGDVKQFGLDSERTNDVYFLWYGGSYLVIRTSGDPLALAPAIRGEIRALDPSAPVSAFHSMQQVLDQSSASRRFTTVLLSIFAAVALALAVIGIYGVMSWSVSQRRQEIGVRMALGADTRAILGLILMRGLKLSAIGLAIGLAATLALSRMLGSLLFEISPHDPWILAGVSLWMLCVTAAACYLPARRATQVDPLTTLRAE